MENSDSFFGFDTRLPEDIERRSTDSPENFEFQLDSLAGLQLDDGTSNMFNRQKPSVVGPDPWRSAAAELDKINTGEFFSDARSSPPSYLADLRSSNSGYSAVDSNWRKASPRPGGERDIEENLADTLARMIDEDSFSSARIDRDYPDPFEKEADFIRGPSPAAPPASRLDSYSAWGSVSSFAGPGDAWAKTDSQNKVVHPTMVNSQSSPAIPSAPSGAGQDISSKPNVIRKVMTLEELEGMMFTKDSENDKKDVEPLMQPQMRIPAVESPRGALRTINNVPYNMNLPSPSGTPGPDARFSPFDMNMPQQRDGQFFMPHGAHLRYPPGMPLPHGVPQNARFPVRPQYQYYQSRVFENANHSQMMRMQNGGMGPPRPQMSHWMSGHQQSMRGMRPMPMNRFQMGKGMPMHNNQYMMHIPRYGIENYEGEEENCGWMTEREKEWVIKVQQSQVKTENPYLDDYYYYVRSLKKSLKESGKGDLLNEQDFIFPARAFSEPREERPNFFEGSLGKVCISSVFNPRRTVDVDPLNIAKTRPPPTNQKRRWFVDPLQKEKGYSKGLLLGIEELYKLILEYQDFSREIAALPADQREQNFETRRNIVNLIFDKLIQGTSPDARARSFSETLKIRKGRELIRRAMPLLFKEQVVILIGYFVRSLPVVVEPVVDGHDAFFLCLTVIGECIRLVKYQALIDMILPMVDAKHGMVDTAYSGHSILALAVKSRFASNFLSLLIAQAERCYQTEWENLESEEKNKWTLFITYYLVSLSKTSPSEVAAISDPEVYIAVSVHIGRFPFSPDQIEGCRAKLRRHE